MSVHQPLKPDGCYEATYRYRLDRAWEAGARAVFIMLNPSTADETRDDPTIRRCTGFAKVFGCGGLVVVNLYAMRATRPADLFAAEGAGVDIIGPENDAVLRAVIADCDGPVIAAWGAYNRVGARAEVVRGIVEDGGRTLECMGLSKHGHPRHPLYLRKDAGLAAFVIR